MLLRLQIWFLFCGATSIMAFLYAMLKFSPLCICVCVSCCCLICNIILQVIDHSRNGETLVIGLMLRRYGVFIFLRLCLISFVRQRVQLLRIFNLVAFGLRCSHLLVLLQSKVDFQHSPLPCDPRGSRSIRQVEACD